MSDLDPILDRWSERGWLRKLDRAFARFLRELDPTAPDALLLAATLASHQLGRGHICLDLAATLRDPDATLSLPPEGEPGEELPAKPSELALLHSLSLESWQQALSTSPLVEHRTAPHSPPLQGGGQEGEGFPASHSPQAIEPGGERISSPLSPATAREGRSVDSPPGAGPTGRGTGGDGFSSPLSPRGRGAGGEGETTAPNTPLVLAGHRLYLRRYWRYEQQVAQAILARLRQPVAPPENLRALLDQLFTEHEQPNWQRLACALATRSAFTVITGGPGTGKTTTVVRLLALLQTAARDAGSPLRIALAAPTGKAAARLTESIGGAVARLPEAMQEGIPTAVSTLHRLLGSRPDTRHFRHGPEHPLPHDLVVVDEASMIDLEMMASLLAALRPEARLILLGDKDQLASVEAGAVLGELCRHAESGDYSPATVAWLKAHSGDDLSQYQGDGAPLAQQTAMLRTSRRFGADSGIGQLAAAVNRGDPTAVSQCWAQGYTDIHPLRLKGPQDPALEQLALHGLPGGHPEARGYSHYLGVLQSTRPEAPDADNQQQWALGVCQAFGAFQILCALRNGPWGVAGLNPRIAEALHRAGLIPATQGWYEGRPVLLTANDYSLGLMNGDVGIALNVVEEDGRQRLRVAFPQPGGGLKWVLPSRLNEVETVYAMTVHKSQGSEFGHAALVLPDGMSPVLTRELVYTGITRAKSAFTLVGVKDGVLLEAVGRRTLRDGGLGELLS